jgi:hypothetical protein
MNTALLRRLAAFATPVALCVLVVLVLARATPHPLDDHFNYQRFIDALAGGRVDLTIPGFHGSDVFAVPVTWLTGSPISQILTLMLFAAALPIVAFLAGRALFGGDREATLFCVLVAMMPFTWIGLLRGWTGPAYWTLMLGSIALARKLPLLAGLALAFAILTKPFALALLPLLWLLCPPERRRLLLLCVASPVLAYMLVQYLQAGRLLFGSHDNLTAATAFQGPVQVALNLAHAVQILFSVHNYYFPDPSLTGPGNLLHTTPVVTFLGLWAITDAGGGWLPTDRRVTIGAGIAVGILLNAVLDHIDRYYLEAAILLFVIAAVPVLSRRPFWWLFAVATLHFQWLYAFLEFRKTFSLDYGFFLLPAIVDCAVAAWLVCEAVRRYGRVRRPQ